MHMPEASDHLSTAAVDEQPDACEHAIAGGSVRVEAVTDAILRVSLQPEQPQPHRSWSIAPITAELVPPVATLESAGQTTRLRTEEMEATLSRTDDGQALQMAIARQDGSQMLAAVCLGFASDGQPLWTSALAEGERVYGGGERTGTLDKRGRSMTHWATDPLPNHDDTTDAMYQSVPFFLGLVDGRVHGVYFDVNERAVADIGKSQPDTFVYRPESHDLVAYVFAGPTFADVLRQYTSLTGRAPSLPRWAFGYQQSRWGYLTADETLAIANQFREQSIPCDAIYLDIDYMRGYRVFTWDPERFPDPASLTRALKEKQMRLVTIIDPGVKVDPDFAVYRDGAANGYFARNPDGSPFQGYVWPGLSAWADFAREDVRTWWGRQHTGLIDAGVAGIWIDMNEPSQAGMFAPQDANEIAHGATLPNDVQHGPIGEPPEMLTHAQFHNAYGLEMARATYDGLRELRPNELPFVLTRAATAGSQRFAIVWNGDSASSWEYLRLSVPLNLGMSLSGFPVLGGDVGGFWGDTTAELLVRWTQFGALLPFYRNHSSIGTIHQEPWSFGEPYTSLCRSAIELHYQLLPYLLTLAHEATATGAPIVRPLAWSAPDDAASIDCDDQFLVGDALLAAPVLEQGATVRDVLLPPGEWFTWDSSEAHPGGGHITVPVTLESLPLYVRSGTVLPLAAVAQSTDEMTQQPLTLHVYLSPEHPTATAEIWLDDERPDAQERGAYGRWQAEATWQGDDLTVELLRRDGQLPWPYPASVIRLHLPAGWKAQPQDAAEHIAGDDFTVHYRVTQG